MKDPNFAERRRQRQQNQSSPQAMREAIRRMNDDPVNIFGATAFVPEDILEAERKEQMRLYRELFPEKYAQLNEAEKRKIEQLIDP